MKPSNVLNVAVVTLCLAASALIGASTPTREATPAQLRSSNVIVILRDQKPELPAVRGIPGVRAAALSASQDPIVTHLQASGATRIHRFELINAVAAHVSPAEAEQLAAHPLVQAVVPERTIVLRRPANAELQLGSTGASLDSGAAASSALCNTLEPEALQLTHTAFLDPSIPQAQRVRDGDGKFVTGKGVKVAWIADGLDPTVAGFTHTDGTPVFVDYRDFSGDPAGTPTAGGEAFGDASSIAANDTPNGRTLFFDISKFVNAAHPLPSPCKIRIRGMAPDASLVGLKVFSLAGATNTALVQAIEYAVVHADVDVINESFGGNPFPDNENDPVALADLAAVRAGVVVVAATGDAGTNGTMGTPSTAPWVISAGATTQLRLYVQTGYGAAPFATNGWISDNISSFSSGGFSMSGPRTPDIVAPGDLGWALCSTNVALFGDCLDFTSAAGAPTPIQVFGGTSESSPLTAGEAALIIQAYRSTHGHADPSPALVKQIIMSTATALGAPPFEQGAGLINALAAVNAALSVGQPPNTGTSLLFSPTSASIDAEPNTPQTVTVAITNTGATRQHLEPSLEALGPAIAGATLTLKLDPAHDPTFINPAGAPRSYIVHKFTVPAGGQHLDAAIAWQAPFTAPPPIAYLGLIDPSGRNAAYTIPQGLGSGYGHVDVVNPAPGTWTAIIWTRPPPPPHTSNGSYSGPVKFSWSTQRFVKFGSVAPTSLDLAPGATQYVSARFTTPRQPGDTNVAIRFAPTFGASAHSDIPIALRTLIPMGPNGGFFTGMLTGGNARGSTGPTQTFAFDVPPGINNMNLGLQVTDNLYLLQGLLIDPNGMQLSVEPNVDASGNSAFAMQLSRANPMPGRWRFILLLNNFVSGNQTSLPFTAQIGLDTAQVNATGIPNGTKLSASAAPLVVPITVTNNGGLSQAYFADVRLNGFTTLAFRTAQTCAAPSFSCWATVLPTQVRAVQFTASSTAPITMDAAGDTGYIVGFTGAPDLTAHPIGPNTVAASLTEPEVPWGEWVMFPTLRGPFGAAGAPTTAVNTSVVAQLKAFDATVSADSGDVWQDVVFGTNTFNPLVLGPGETGTIRVTIKPHASQIGHIVRGVIYVDTFNGTVQTGDELVALPYSYEVVP